MRSSFPHLLQSPINCGVFAMVGGLLLVPIVSAFTKKTLPQNVQDKFDCYNATVVTNKKDSLG